MYIQSYEGRYLSFHIYRHPFEFDTIPYISFPKWKIFVSRDITLFQKIILIVAINTYERTFKVAPSAPQRIAENNSLVVLDRDISFTLPCNFFPFVDFVFSSCVLFRLYTVFHVERTIAKDHEPPKKLKLSFRFRSFLPMCIYDTLEIPRAVASIKVVALRAKKIERQRARERERESEVREGKKDSWGNFKRSQCFSPSPRNSVVILLGFLLLGKETRSTSSVTDVVTDRTTFKYISAYISALS